MPIQTAHTSERINMTFGQNHFQNGANPQSILFFSPQILRQYTNAVYTSLLYIHTPPRDLLPEFG